MLDTAFSTPVVVIVGMGFPLEIRSVLAALRYLDEQPEMSRDEAYHATYSVCRDALDGSVIVSEARDMLCALSRRSGVLVEGDWAHPALIGDETPLNA